MSAHLSFVLFRRFAAMLAAMLGLGSAAAQDTGRRLLTEITDANINQAVAEWKGNKKSAAVNYGNITDWDISSVTDFADLFNQKNTFNDDIESWDTGAVTTLSNTFYYARAFNQDISNWNTGMVTSFSQTFFTSEDFN